jgi:7-cyano-7-deazaguanine synthase
VITAILHSGGLDSTVCMYRAKEQGHSVLSIGVDYGQCHAIELTYAAVQCKRLNVSRFLLKVEWTKPVREIPLHRTVEQMRTGSPAFLPGRNVILLSLACAEAATRGAKEVWIGVNAVDYSGYPDCRPSFIRAYNAMLAEAVPEGPVVVAPLLALSKPQIAAEAHRLGIMPGDTWSCYRPDTSELIASPCGACDACTLHKRAWQAVAGAHQ